MGQNRMKDQQDDLVSKVLAVQARCPKLKTQNPCKARRRIPKYVLCLPYEHRGTCVLTRKISYTHT